MEAGAYRLEGSTLRRLLCAQCQYIPMERRIKNWAGKHSVQTAKWLHVLGLLFFLSLLFGSVCLNLSTGFLLKRGPERSLTAIKGAHLWRKGLPLLHQADRLGPADL